MFAKTQSKKIVCSQEATTRIPHHTQFKSNVSHLKSSFGQRKSYAMDRIDYLVNSHTILTCLLLQLFTNSASTRLDIFTHLNLVMPMKRKFSTRILVYHNIVHRQASTVNRIRVSGTLMSILPERQLIKQQMLYH